MRTAALLLSCFATLLPVGGCGQETSRAPASRPVEGTRTISPGGLDAITEELIRRYVNIIADDSMLGRDTPSRGLELTANFIATNFQRLGLRPAGDSGGFVQRYPLTRSGPAIGSPDPAGYDPGSAPNVVGILPGTDSLLRNEYVVLSAHMDHVGVHPGATDSIWNGADDNASGTAGILALAEAFAASPTRRSIIFLTVSGEEKGLLGSRWFASHAPVPVESIVADLNLDMIGRNWTDTIAVIGQEHSDLGQTLQRVVALHPELGLTAVGDLWPAENFFVRSDHYNFVRQGIPALFFFNGTHEDYHQASDSPDRIDAEKESRVARLIFLVATEVANATQRPIWNPESRRRLVPQAFFPPTPQPH